MSETHSSGTYEAAVEVRKKLKSILKKIHQNTEF